MKEEAKKKEYWATGRRKTAVARVRLRENGSGKITVNKKEFEQYFPIETCRVFIVKPLELSKTQQKYDIFVNVSGGGISGQAGALRHGIARALLRSDENLKLPLKHAGVLTRDSRMKERKKYGRAKARKRFQFSKR